MTRYTGHCRQESHKLHWNTKPPVFSLSAWKRVFRVEGEVKGRPQILSLMVVTEQLQGACSRQREPEPPSLCPWMRAHPPENGATQRKYTKLRDD